MQETRVRGAAALHIDELKARLAGEVIVPGDAAYDAARQVATANVDRRPAAIARVRDDGDVARVIGFAREAGAELAVRGGGHSAAGHGTTDGGVVLDLSAMKALEIDAAQRTAWAEAGLTAGEVTRAAGAHGLAVGFGDTGSVGIAGITLGGGVGYLSRRFGLTIDSLLAADVVTASGEVLRVDADHEPELFWAIRGGGGNFGVVTRLQYRLSEVPSVVGGMLVMPATPEVVAGFLAEAQAAPDELSAIVSVMTAPPVPFIPPEHHGRPIVLASMAYAGDAEPGLRALAPFRALAAPIADMLRPMRYPDLFPPDQPMPRMASASRTLFLDGLDARAAQLLIDRVEEHGRTSGAFMVAAQFRALGGAVARIPVDATAFAHREARVMGNVASMFAPNADPAPHLAWAESVASQLASGPAAYANFLGDEGPERVRAAYPGATWQRLVAAKRRYDPGNLFRLNQNIPPEG